MKDFEIVIQNSTGLHARPAKKLANLAKTYQSSIQIQHGEKKVNAKSLISILTLGVEGGCSIRVTVDGADEERASHELYEAIQSGLGESEPAASQDTVSPENTQSEFQPVIEENDDTLLKGVACSPGMTIGPVFQYVRPEIKIRSHFLGVEEESDCFKKAITEAITQLEEIHEKMALGLAQKETAIIEVHIEILNDQDLINETLTQIQCSQAASTAWKNVIEKRVVQLQALDRKSVV